MSRLIEDMLFLANSDANAWRLSMEDTALDTLLLDVFEKYEPEAAKKEHPLSISLPKEEIPLCCCDGQRITQVLCILMDNAFSHTPAGSRVALSLSVMEHHFILKVSDNGPAFRMQRKKRFSSGSIGRRIPGPTKNISVWDFASQKRSLKRTADRSG